MPCLTINAPSVIPYITMQDKQLEAMASSLFENIYTHPKEAIIEDALLRLADEPSISAIAPEAPTLAENLIETNKSGAMPPLEREVALAELYRVLHMAGAEYSDDETQVIKRTNGIPRQPGGVTPLLMAEQFISSNATVVDLGAGNGLQGLLLRKLIPHKRTVLIEISGAMIEAGKLFQQVMEGEHSAIDWVHGDLMELDFKEIIPETPELLYMYRPVKPVGEGKRLYERISKWIDGWDSTGHIVSVADCLGPFLSDSVIKLYEGDFFTLYRK